MSQMADTLADTPLIAWMKQLDIPITRESFIQACWGDNPPIRGMPKQRIRYQKSCRIGHGCRTPATPKPSMPPAIFPPIRQRMTIPKAIWMTRKMPTMVKTRTMRKRKNKANDLRGMPRDQVHHPDRPNRRDRSLPDMQRDRVGLLLRGNRSQLRRYQCPT